MAIYTDYTKEFNPVSAWIKLTLKDKQAAFAKEPNALNWNLCLKAMYVHQQFKFAVRSVTVDREALSAALDHAPIGDWADIISRATTGMTVKEVLGTSSVYTL